MKSRFWWTAFYLFGITLGSQAAVFLVTNTADSGPGTLRQAILNANANPGLDTINFNIPGAGIHTIFPTNTLPAITNAVFIDGFSQPGSSANTLTNGDNSVHLIRLDGVHCLDTFAEGLKFTTAYAFDPSPASGSTVRGLCIVRFHYGIYANEISDFTISGNWIGLDLDGIARGNQTSGIYLSSFFNLARRNVIGGATPAARNIVSGNVTGAGPGGIYLSGSTTIDSFIQGNFIGTDSTGTLPRGNAFGGITISGCSNILVGGATANTRNIISATTAAGGDGLTVSGPNNIIQGNFVGSDVTGQYDLGNLYDGISVSSATGTKILGNLVVNNRKNGITLGNNAVNSVLENNLIGTDATGARPLGNGAAGITISGSTNRIGGLSPGQANTIFHNTGPGIEITSSSARHNEISGNAIYNNGGLALDLAPAGPAPNDLLDPDTGANELQNFPELTSATSAFSALTVQGTLNSQALSTYRIEFFATPTWDETATPEGKVFLGALTVSTDGNGTTGFTTALGTVPDSNYLITATATDAANNTSEYSSGISITSSGAARPTLAIAKSGSGVSATTTISWPSAASLFTLERTTSLTPPIVWQPVTSGITEDNATKTFTVTNDLTNPSLFFRLKKP